MDLLEELLKNIAECLQCSICQNIFKSVTLPCGHSYCIDCISEYRKAKALTRIDCPECRHRFQPPIKFKKNVTLCDMAKMYHDFRRYVSNEESTGPQMAMEVCDVALQTSASLEDRLESHALPEQAEAKDADIQPSAEATQVPDPPESPLQELPISPSTHRHRAQDIPPPLPDASFTRLTLTPALGHRRLVWNGYKVSTRRASSVTYGDRFDISQCMAEQEFSQGCHYWDVDTSESVGWAVGVAYPGMGRQEQLGRTPGSWCVEWSTSRLSYWHNNVEDPLKHGRHDLVRVVLDMSNGTLSFYGLSAVHTLLHCVQEGFSEPVRPVFWLFGLKVPNALSFPGNQ
ncbi:E3 ubiquitin/ISG15 ligase TRIM25 [Hypomesus transpacificus]|uniref:E3 ubiquitin/ISG15 ligase TRIM25 n=1 Tax=Hypomesus transpacificus TaxID=137520 RepID=UPI001F07DCE1|nr:E3 ubiquitin/ISG15 ligase TRIM25 [Hypomesus transpacificus]